MKSCSLYTIYISYGHYSPLILRRTNKEERGYKVEKRKQGRSQHETSEVEGGEEEEELEGLSLHYQQLRSLIDQCSGRPPDWL